MKQVIVFDDDDILDLLGVLKFIVRKIINSDGININ